METTTRALACSPSRTGHAQALEHQQVAQRLVHHTGREIPVEPHLRVNEKGRRIALIAGIVLGHVVTLFGPLLLGRWPVVPL
ncbi:hypothetical protein AAur_4115 [Paenarthrobacter aurescens TC1]|uniref:Uncharacterized protein n=1 Tax=Paenarthrobacter aurescens (strain TC1) TaxID=290340 RepID=A1RC20_PAEAT|nr:hypothetical protein AAur_4115 [Paenarthrobacter aurescens TC1]